jgi:hypothetical protein
MANAYINECYERFDINDEQLSVSPDLAGLTARRLIGLADGMDHVAELLRTMIDQCPNSTDSDRPLAMLEGALALQNKQAADFSCLAVGTLLLMRGG